MPWEDPSDWVIKTCPWMSQGGTETSESPPLLRLRPEDVGYDVQAAAAAAAAGAKTTPASLQTDTETTAADPLVRVSAFLGVGDFILSFLHICRLRANCLNTGLNFHVD